MEHNWIEEDIEEYLDAKRYSVKNCILCRLKKITYDDDQTYYYITNSDKTIDNYPVDYISCDDMIIKNVIS